MPHDPQKFLEDMAGSARFILVAAAPRGIDDYVTDRLFRRAIERELQIIGEALLQLHRVAPQLAGRITDHPQIISFRHVLVHGYDHLDADVVWSIIREKLPGFLVEVQSLLAGLNEG